MVTDFFELTMTLQNYNFYLWIRSLYYFNSISLGELALLIENEASAGYGSCHFSTAAIPIWSQTCQILILSDQRLKTRPRSLLKELQYVRKKIALVNDFWRSFSIYENFQSEMPFYELSITLLSLNSSNSNQFVTLEIIAKLLSIEFVCTSC